VRVLLADDDSHVRSALRLLLDQEPGVSIVGDCAAAESLVDLVECTRPTVVLLDWDLPGLRTSGELDRLRAAYPACQLVALSGRPEQRNEALRAGVSRFVSKGDAPENLLEALRGLASRQPQAESNDQPEGDVGRPKAFKIVK
jgi:DNA-binding NarL/FixJ family response regulator